MDKLGSKIYTATVALKGFITEEQCIKLTDALVENIGMTKAHEGTMYRYPVDGKGDGYIYIQTIIESFIAWDVWYSLQGAYLTICSCKPFDTSQIFTTFRGTDIIINEISSRNMNM